MATITLESKYLKLQYIKLDKIEKIELFQHKICQIQYLRRASRHWWKEKVILFGVFGKVQPLTLLRGEDNWLSYETWQKNGGGGGISYTVT